MFCGWFLHAIHVHLKWTLTLFQFYSERPNVFRFVSFSTWKETILEVQQPSFFWPLCLIFTWIIAFNPPKETKVCNYADGTTIYACRPNIKDVIVHSENAALKIIEWSPNNGIKVNEDKWHIMISGVKGSNETASKIGRCSCQSTCWEKSSLHNLWLIIFLQAARCDSLQKGKQKLHALARISRQTDTENCSS